MEQLSKFGDLLTNPDSNVLPESLDNIATFVVSAMANLESVSLHGFHTHQAASFLNN